MASEQILCRLLASAGVAEIGDDDPFDVTE